MTRRTAVGWMPASLHNHMGQIVQNEDEVDRCMAAADPKRFRYSPDTAHLHPAGIDSAKSLEKHSADVANKLEPVYA
jgi:sugar phosphate isomerase/epimerase